MSSHQEWEAIGLIYGVIVNIILAKIRVENSIRLLVVVVRALQIENAAEVEPTRNRISKHCKTSRPRGCMLQEL